MVDFEVPAASLVIAGASTYPAFHILREFAKVVLKPIEPPPSKTVPQLAQSTPSTSSTTLGDDGAWFPIPFFGTVQTPAFTPAPTPFVHQSLLPQAAARVKNLDHLPSVLSSDPARAMMVFIFIVTSYFFIQFFFARYIQLRKRFSPVTHIISTAITVYLYTLTGPASHYSLLNMPVTLHQAKESALPVACAALATFSIFNVLISVAESLFRNVLAGIKVSAIPDRMKPSIEVIILLGALAPVLWRVHQLRNGVVPFEVTVRREIESNLASVDPRFVAIVIMAFVALCVLDMLLGCLQWCNIPLFGLSVSTFTCGPVVLVVRIFQALVYVIFRCRPFLILAIAYTSRTWASYMKGEVEPESLDDLSDSDVSSMRGTHQHETGLTDAARPTDVSRLINYLEAKLLAQQADLGARDSEIAELKRRTETAERANARKQADLTSALKMVASKDVEIAKLQWRMAHDKKAAQDDRALMEERLKHERLRRTRTTPTTEAGVQTLPVVSTNATTTTIAPVPVVEKAEFGVQINEPPRHLVHASTQSVQHNPVLIDSATQTTDTLRVLVDSSIQAQEPSRQFTETAVQAVEPIRVFAHSNTQTEVPPPTVPAAEYEKALLELEELRIRLRDVESKLQEIDASQAMEPTRVFADSTAQTDVPAPTVSAAEHEKALTELDELRIRLRDVESKLQEIDAAQVLESTRVFADSTIQTDIPPPTVPAAEYEKALMELNELRIRLHEIETKREEVDVAQAEKEVHNEQEACEQDDASIQLPDGGPKVSIQALAAFLGAKLNQAFAPQVTDCMPEGDEEEDDVVEAEENPHAPPTDESRLALVTHSTAPIPNVSPDLYSTYETIAGKKFTVPVEPDAEKLDKMPLRQWIMCALQTLYVARLGKYSEVIKSQASKQVQGWNTAATQALGQGNHALVIALRQLAQAHTLSKMSSGKVNGSQVPAYVTVDWKRKKPMDDDRIGRSFYRLQRHVLDAIRDKVNPNPFVVSALNLMEFSIAFAERLYSDIKEPDWFTNSTHPDVRKARLWIKQEAGVWLMDEDLLSLAELIQDDWKWRSSYKAHIKCDTQEEPGYALLKIKRGMELAVSVAEEAGEQPLTEIEEMKPKKRSDGRWGHEMAHYSDQVKEDYDGPSVDESTDQEEEAEVEAEIEVPTDPKPVLVRLQPEIMPPPVETQTIQPLEEPELVPVPTCNEEKGKGRDPTLAKQNSLTDAEKELGPANFEPTANFSWDDELARQPNTNTQPPSTTPHPQQGRVYHNHPSRSFHGHGDNRGIPLQIETERNPNITRQPASSSVSPATDTQTSFASGLMASRHAPKPTGSMASMHAPRPTGLYASMHAPSPPTPQPAGTMASMHAPRPSGSMASMHAPKPSTSPVLDRNRSMHADDPSPPVSPSTSHHNRNRDRGRRGARSGLRIGSHQIN